MTVPGNIDALLLGGQRGYQISRSLRFNSADSAYLNRTTGTPTDNKKWTWSGWAKISGANQAVNFGSSGSGTSLYFGIETGQGDTFIMQIAGTRVYKSTAVFRDPSSWYHFVFVFDSANGTQADRSILYVNGVRQAATTTSVTLNQTTGFNSASGVMQLGYSNAWSATSADYFSGYLTEINFIDGQALTPSSFGETDTITGVWKPKKYAGTYGTNGFYLNFSDNSGTTSTTLGKDSSGNSNNWTPNNFSVTAGSGNDSLIDTPTPYADGGNGRGNYCTANPLKKSASATLSDGNLSVAINSNGGEQPATFAVSSGKWYWEVSPNAAFSAPGILLTSRTPSASSFANDYHYYGNTGLFYTGVSGVTYGAGFGNGDVIGVALDLDTNQITFYKNGVSQGAKTIAAGEYNPDLAGATTVTNVANFGQRPFAYTPPSGFVALNTQNLPEPSIKKPSSYFDATLYTGTGVARSITGLGFSPDFVWTKVRSSANDHKLYDAVRGATKVLESSNTGAEGTDTQGLTAFNSDGFSLGTASSSNANGSTYVAWCWDESATPGFDIVTYTGTGSNRTIAHSLGVAPSMMIVKRRDSGVGATNWFVYHSRLNNGVNPAQYYLQLQSTNGTGGLSSVWNDTAPTSSVFSVGTSSETNGSGGTFVAYLWSEVAGFSKFGSYTGNGSSDGVYIHLGFTPAVVIVKQTNSSNDWVILDNRRDPYNSAYNSILFPNVSVAENSGANKYWDFLSNGIKIRGTSSAINGSGSTYVFCAWAETPAKFALAR